MTRADVMNILRDAIRSGEIKSSKLDGSKNVVVCVQTADDDSSATDSEVCTQGPLQFKPVDGSDALFLELGDERRVLSIKNRDWQISIADGEVVLQALGGTTPAYLHLKPNGDATLKGASLSLNMSSAATLKCTNFTVDMSGETKIGNSAAQFAALANLVTAQFNTLKAAIGAAGVVAGDGGAAFKAALVAALATWPSNIAASKTKVL